MEYLHYNYRKLFIIYRGQITIELNYFLFLNEEKVGNRLITNYSYKYFVVEVTVCEAPVFLFLPQ